EHAFAHRHLEGTTHVDDDRAACESGRGVQRDAADGFRIEMADHFDDDAAVVTGSQLAVELGQALGKLGIHDAAAYGDHGALTRLSLRVHMVCFTVPLTSRGAPRQGYQGLPFRNTARPRRRRGSFAYWRSRQAGCHLAEPDRRVS